MVLMSIHSEIDYTVESTNSVQNLVDVLTEKLGKRGFGVLANIDVKKIINQKLGEEISEYVILEVCSPRHAKKAIDAHKQIGLMLPCKIIAYRDQGLSRLSMYRPTKAIEFLNFKDLDLLAREVEHEIRRAIDETIEEQRK